MRTANPNIWLAMWVFLLAMACTAAASYGDEIRVAQGSYKPDLDEAGSVTPGNREETFQLINGVALKGGYAGAGEPDPNERNNDDNEVSFIVSVGVCGKYCTGCYCDYYC